jgi:dethiobiotin synthetase
MTAGFFITGTDTEIGKTWCTVALLTALRQRGHTALGMKPVASGCVRTHDGLRSDDALLLMQHSSPPVPPYALINPYAFAAPIAPHLAAQQAGLDIRLELIVDNARKLQGQTGLIVVEGVGGWCVPLNARETVADLALALGLPVILVVGIRLGCLNHALLTAAALRQSGNRLAGWIANRIEPATLCAEENIASLRERLAAPLLGVMPYMENFDAERLADRLELKPLLKDLGSAVP